MMFKRMIDNFSGTIKYRVINVKPEEALSKNAAIVNTYSYFYMAVTC